MKRIPILKTVIFRLYLSVIIFIKVMILLFSYYLEIVLLFSYHLEINNYILKLF